MVDIDKMMDKIENTKFNNVKGNFSVGPAGETDHMAMKMRYDLAPDMDVAEFLKEEIELGVLSGVLFSIGYNPKSRQALTMVYLN